MLNLNKQKNNRWMIYPMFALMLALLVFMTVSLSKERKKSELINNELINLDSENLKVSEWEDEQDLFDNYPESDDYLNDRDFQFLSIGREDNLNNNLSELSPVKEVLGGTFFITSINWLNRDTAIIEYEDGHIALSAEVVFLENSSEVQKFSNISLEGDAMSDLDYDLDN